MKEKSKAALKDFYDLQRVLDRKQTHLEVQDSGYQRNVVSRFSEDTGVKCPVIRFGNRAWVLMIQNIIKEGKKK